MSKQTHRCRRQKCKHCKQKLICTWDMHVCKPAHTRKQPTGNQALVQHRRVLTGCGQMRSSDVNRGGRRRASRSVARVLRMCVCVCPSWSGDKGAIEWKRKERADFAQFSGHLYLPASSLTVDCGNESFGGAFFPNMRIYLLFRWGN